MKYSVIIEKRAEKFLNRLAKSERDRILSAIGELPHKGDIMPLQGDKNRGMFRLRVGHYRIIYTVDNDRLIIHIVDAGNRGQIYNRY